ncbi:RND transporter [Acinetobacter sp. KAM398]|uniref:HlyD family secretion protein n=1 Tax=unclassified Acinetobacter TaxID=196816 RepID=UPI001F361A9C|nr:MULTISPECIES: biotin/lipoyl-binding protein [unclassified Acinetobacter]GJC30379.1 RND transporter [Acinetobacter sp. KAM392]GJC33188.1 RND transporter [Acinetobacter sp. KAM393]GJC36017.1 RND transporter [Acinetobacter sp. KAM394]GJC38836.1 RND transporter [Acinetobacter sp. KAM395]GJC41935.1 RND transporter [Acinetobacter sp. KAM396]
MSENQSLTANSASEQRTPIHQQMDNEIENNDKLLESESVDTSQTAQDQTQALKPDSTKSRNLKIFATLLLILILSLIGFGLWKSYQPQQIELQGRVEAETIYVSTKVPSRIEELYVQEGQVVKQNQPLVRLWSPEVSAKKQQALASLQSALAFQSTATRGSQQENIDSLYANWQALKAQEALANTTLQRSINLFREGVISRQRRDEIQAAATSASQMTEAAYQQYARAKRGSTPEQKSTADAQVEIAKAAVAEANALEAETQLNAPVDGVVSKTYGKVSELIAMGVPVVSIIQNDIWVSLTVREDQYASIYKLKQLQGYIPALNQYMLFNIKNIDAEGEFATIKTTRQTGGYDIRSFKVHLVPATPNPNLKVGMSVLFKLNKAR